MTKCDFCGNCTSKGECLGPKETHQVGGGLVRYCSEAADRYLSFCEKTLNSYVAHLETTLKGNLNV